MFNNSVEIRLPVLFWISFFLHLVVFLGILIYKYDPIEYAAGARKISESGGTPTRDVIVNINEDNVKAYTRTTLLSDKDSSARGHITQEKGDRWLNNSLEFILKKGRSGDKDSGRSSPKKRRQYCYPG